MKTLLPEDYEYVFAYFDKPMYLKYEEILGRLHGIRLRVPIYTALHISPYVKLAITNTLNNHDWPTISSNPLFGVL